MGKELLKIEEQKAIACLVSEGTHKGRINDVEWQFQHKEDFSGNIDRIVELIAEGLTGASYPSTWSLELKHVHMEPDTIWRITEDDFDCVLDDKDIVLGESEKQKLFKEARRNFAIGNWAEWVFYFIKEYRKSN